MRMISGFGRKTKQAIACAALLVPAAAWAQGVPVEDDDLAGVWGQAMLTVENSAGSGFDFTKITLNADVKLNANLTNIQLGKVGTNPADVDIGELRFVSSGDLGADKYVKMTDPYIEFVYKNQADQSQREIIGLRLGFGAIDGNIGLKLNGLKGNILLTQAADATDAYGDLKLNSATRATDFTCSAGCATLGVGQVGSVRATNSTDFFISLLSQAATFSDNTTAPEGVSMNWTKGVSYVNARGNILDNPLPSLQKRQGG